MITFTSFLLAVLLSNPHSAYSLQAQAPSAPSPAVPGGQPASSSSSSSSKTKNKPLPSFLIIGTVFDEKAFSLTGVQVRIRRSGEKKFRWETYTNSRGEFAVRVPPGYGYEVVSHMKSYQDHSETVDGKVDVQQRLSIKMQSSGQARTGAKP
ncbi:MAG: carboxypeptidase-like regulatory domain-containing protein [Candidatus Acidiferrum sp.]